jgi:hypothetical protein
VDTTEIMGSWKRREGGEEDRVNTRDETSRIDGRSKPMTTLTAILLV